MVQLTIPWKGTAYYEIVVYPAPGGKERVVYTVAYTLRSTEIHGRTVHLGNLTRRACRVVQRRVFVGEHLQSMVADITTALARKVEVCVVGQSDNGWLVCFRLEG